MASAPAADSTVNAPVEELVLRFSTPASLNEVTISGPNGQQPMMIHPAGEVADYSLPLAGLGPGSYTVNWRATARGSTYQGSFSFRVT